MRSLVTGDIHHPFGTQWFRAQDHSTRSCWAAVMRHALLLLALLFPAAVTAEDQPLELTEANKKLLGTFDDEFVRITPGEGKFPASFSLGDAKGPESEQPVREVRLSKPFSIAKYEVPQNLYEAVMGVNPSKWKGPRNSVEMLTPAEAETFCARATTALRAMGRLQATEVIRLPSEAEWEYSARAGTTTAYSFGDEARDATDAGNKASRLDAFGWHTGNAAGNDPPVGALKPNPWGLYDMHGYLWEITADGWAESHADGPADGGPRAVGDDGQRVRKSGSWKDRYESLRSAARKPYAAEGKDDAVGFRCVKALR
jgi:formylglycine-generating enzyme required for sulfatase activity